MGLDTTTTKLRPLARKRFEAMTNTQREFSKLVRKLMEERGYSRSDAVSAARKENPELHKRMLSEANPGRPVQLECLNA